jgi:hypothetical protein
MTVRSAGVFTATLALIALGLIVLLHESIGTSYRVLDYFWPLVLIAFGIELVSGVFRPGGTRFSAWSIGLLTLVLLCSLGFYAFPSLPAMAFGFGTQYEVPVKGQLKVGSDIRAVDIDLANTAVAVRGTASGDVSYDGVLATEAQTTADAVKAMRAEWSVRQVGHTLVLSLTYPADEGIPVRGWLTQFSEPAPYLNVVVPAALLSRVTTTNARVTVEGMAGASDVHTSNGDVSLSHVASDASVRTSNGTVDLDSISGAVDASTTNAAVNAVSQVGGDWRVATTNGPVQLRLAGAASAHISASTTNAAIGGNIRWSYAGGGQSQATATVGTGGDRIVLTSTNGSIDVDTKH